MSASRLNRSACTRLSRGRSTAPKRTYSSPLASESASTTRASSSFTPAPAPAPGLFARPARREARKPRRAPRWRSALPALVEDEHENDYDEYDGSDSSGSDSDDAVA